MIEIIPLPTLPAEEGANFLDRLYRFSDLASGKRLPDRIRMADDRYPVKDIIKICRFIGPSITVRIIYTGKVYFTGPNAVTEHNLYIHQRATGNDQVQFVGPNAAEEAAIYFHQQIANAIVSLFANDIEPDSTLLRDLIEEFDAPSTYISAETLEQLFESFQDSRNRFPWQ